MSEPNTSNSTRIYLVIIIILIFINIFQQHHYHTELSKQISMEGAISEFAIESAIMKIDSLGRIMQTLELRYRDALWGVLVE